MAGGRQIEKGIQFKYTVKRYDRGKHCIKSKTEKDTPMQMVGKKGGNMVREVIQGGSPRSSVTVRKKRIHYGSA